MKANGDKQQRLYSKTQQGSLYKQQEYVSMELKWHIKSGESLTIRPATRTTTYKLVFTNGRHMDVATSFTKSTKLRLQQGTERLNGKTNSKGNVIKTFNIFTPTTTGVA